MKKLKVLDLFSGIGMFSYGLHKTGLYETVAFCDVDKSCINLLKKRFTNVSCFFEDVSNIHGTPDWVNETYDKTPGYELNISRQVDVVVGGFPCQDISNSGSKEGLDGSRSNLWFEMLRLIKEIKPKGVIIENVSAIKTRGLREVLEGLYSVGYDAEWHSIPAGYCGAIHKRDRMFIIAYPISIGQQKSWRPLEPFDPEETRNRETGIIKHVLQGKPMPYLCRSHDGGSNRVDRLKQVGNTVYWPIVERLGYHLYNNIEGVNK